MNGSEKQIKWANEIIAEHNEVVSSHPKWTEFAEMDINWDTADASKIIDMRGWAIREEDLGFGQKANARFNKTKFHNMMFDVFGMN